MISLIEFSTSLLFFIFIILKIAFIEFAYFSPSSNEISLFIYKLVLFAITQIKIFFSSIK